MSVPDQILAWLSHGTDSYCHWLIRQLENSHRFFRESPVADFAEYHTNWQLSLDGNLPGEVRAHHKQIAEAAARRIALTISV